MTLHRAVLPQVFPAAATCMQMAARYKTNYEHKTDHQLMSVKRGQDVDCHTTGHVKQLAIYTVRAGAPLFSLMKAAHKSAADGQGLSLEGLSCTTCMESEALPHIQSAAV